MLRFTAKELLVLAQCIRIAVEDRSIETYDPSGRIVASIRKKLGLKEVA